MVRTTANDRKVGEKEVGLSWVFWGKFCEIPKLFSLAHKILFLKQQQNQKLVSIVIFCKGDKS